MTIGTLTGRTLSKSDFMLARNCDAKLYLRENHFRDQREFDPYLGLLRDGGFMVEALAQAKRPDGIQADRTSDASDDFDRTLDLLARDTVTIFQATLLNGRRLARIDILEKVGNFVRLIEVKAKSFDGAEHAENLANGGVGVFRGMKKPYRVKEEWRNKIEDVAYQMILLRRVLPTVTIQPFLLLVDKNKRSTLDNLPRLFELTRETTSDGRDRSNHARFIGTADQLAQLDLLTEVDVSEEVEMLLDEVESAAVHYESILDDEWDPAFAVRGAKCKDCEFKLDGDDDGSGFVHCWGDLALASPHMLELFSIGSVKDTDGAPLVENLVNAGKASLFDIPESRLVKKDGSIGPQAARQLRQIRCTRREETWISPDLRGRIDRLSYPLHFIDFEVSRLALPYHARMRCYGQVAFQWSCHTVASPGAVPTHREWLNTDDVWPNTSFVYALRQAIGDSATVLTWSGYEGSRLNEIVRELEHFDASDPELVAWIRNVVDNRIVDLNAWATNDFYHPGMRGRTSIKVVLDALWKIDSAMRNQFTSWTGREATESKDPYHALPPLEINGVIQDVREGTGAIRAYEAMMYGVEKNDEAAKKAWCTLLLQYCKLDTLSMVMIFEYWRRVTRNGQLVRESQPRETQVREARGLAWRFEDETDS
jgi:hypothetical protein